MCAVWVSVFSENRGLIWNIKFQSNLHRRKRNAPQGDEAVAPANVSAELVTRAMHKPPYWPMWMKFLPVDEIPYRQLPFNTEHEWSAGEKLHWKSFKALNQRKKLSNASSLWNLHVTPNGDGAVFLSYLPLKILLIDQVGYQYL